MKSSQKAGIFFAILAAALYAINAPFSKLLMASVPPRVMASLLYLGAGLGMAIVGAAQKMTHRQLNAPSLAKDDLPYIIGMILLDIAAPIFLMMGLNSSSAASVSLLNNFEIVATSLIALTLFREAISKRLWLAIIFVTIASLLLSIDDVESLTFSVGSVFVLLACICWGFENNCTRRLSDKNPLQIVIVKGLGSGIGAMIVALICGDALTGGMAVLGVLLLGFVAYGLSIFFYVRAQAVLGAAKTSTYYAIAPFIGSGLSLLIFRELPSNLFWIALLVMGAGTYLASTDRP